MSETKPAFVLVHGAWHDSATWARVAPLLEAKGHRVAAIDLPGAGANARFPKSYSRRPLDPAAFATEPSPNAGVTQADRTAAVIGAIDAFGGDVVLVGHSLGGLTVSSVAEMAPEKLHAVVYLTAFILPPGVPAIAMIQHETMSAALVSSLLRADPPAVGALRLDTAPPDAADLARLKDTFYGDVSDADFAAFAKNLHCDEPLGVTLEPSPITPDRFGRVRRHYVRCLQDHAITIAGQDFMIAAVNDAIGGTTEVATLDASHSPFLSQPDALAAMLLSAARA